MRQSHHGSEQCLNRPNLSVNADQLFPLTLNLERVRTLKAMPNEFALLLELEQPTLQFRGGRLAVGNPTDSVRADSADRVEHGTANERRSPDDRPSLYNSERLYGRAKKDGQPRASNQRTEPHGNCASHVETVSAMVA